VTETLYLEKDPVSSMTAAQAYWALATDRRVPSRVCGYRVGSSGTPHARTGPTTLWPNPVSSWI
jgi:hypothetical protein